MHRFFLLTVALLAFLQANAQIDKTGYTLVYSSETPETASGQLTLSTEELANCTGDFVSTDNLIRNWNYSPRQTSTWNNRMAETDADHSRVCVCDSTGTLRMLALCTDSTAESCITSGLEMKQGYKYGIFEIKAKCNPHASNFPAIWMMPVDQHAGWPNCGEIDIMEQIGSRSVAYSTVHLGARYDQSVGKTYSWSKSRTVTKNNYHIYSLLWNDSTLTFYYDGTQVFQYAKDNTLDLINHPEYQDAQFPYDKAFYLILDQAVGMNYNWGSENPDPTYIYEMDVEYVRIFQPIESPNAIHNVSIPQSCNVRKFIRNDAYIIAVGDKEYTLSGVRIK